MARRGSGKEMKFMSALAMMVVVMMMMMLTKPSDAQMNITAARAHLKEGWWNPNYTRQILEPEERYYFEQVLAGLDLDDMDIDEDNDVRPQAGECIRKEYRRLTPDEVRAYHAALNALKVNRQYRTLITFHRPAASPGAHFGPAFLPWHRCYLIRFETAIQGHCPQCCVPYIDSRLDCSLRRPIDSALYSRRHFGNVRGAVRTGMAANWRAEPPDCDISGTGRLVRNMDSSGFLCSGGLLYTNAMVQRHLGRRSYDSLCQPYDLSEFEDDHGGYHMVVGGHMGELACAPNDPVFFSHHANVDKLMEQVRGRVPANQWTYPRDSFFIPNRQRGRDPMRPFEYRNADGLDDEAIGKNYLYEISPADITCRTEADCGPLGLLWCDTSGTRGECKAKCRNGGICSSGFNASCYCETGTPQCVAQRCRCETT